MTGGKPADLMGRGIWPIKTKSTPAFVPTSNR